MGRHLGGLTHEAGSSVLDLSAEFECYGTPVRRQWYSRFWSQFSVISPYAEQWLQRGWAQREELEQIRDAWLTWAEIPHAFLAEAWGQVVGRK